MDVQPTGGALPVISNKAIGGAKRASAGANPAKEAAKPTEASPAADPNRTLGTNLDVTEADPPLGSLANGKPQPDVATSQKMPQDGWEYGETPPLIDFEA
jgi:hypothetical protein